MGFIQCAGLEIAEAAINGSWREWSGVEAIGSDIRELLGKTLTPDTIAVVLVYKTAEKVREGSRTIAARLKTRDWWKTVVDAGCC
jgi:hypothetical protein